MLDIEFQENIKLKPKNKKKNLKNSHIPKRFLTR